MTAALTILGIWVAPGPLLGLAMLVVCRGAERFDPADYKRCPGHDPNDPSSKQCWVHVDEGDYCPRHDGSGREAIYV